MSCWCDAPVSTQEGFAAGDGNVAGQHLEGGGFSGSVDPQEPETLSDPTGGVSETASNMAALPVARAHAYLTAAGGSNTAAPRRRLVEEELDIRLFTNTTTSESTARANSGKNRLPTAFPPHPSRLGSPRHAASAFPPRPCGRK